MRREVEKWWRWTLERWQMFSADDGRPWALLAATTRDDLQRSHLKRLSRRQAADKELAVTARSWWWRRQEVRHRLWQWQTNT
eukprot:11882069-Ditylum_brightwellii.AAC.1